MAVQLPDDFKEFLRLLNDRNVDYLLIGGYAVGYHGYPRATNELDVWIGASTDNVGKVIDALKAFGLDTPDLNADLFADGRIVRIGVPPIRIEVMSEISGVDFPSCFEARLRDTIDGVSIQIIDLENLKQNKRASGRFKDLDDLENLD
jgi:predicted nucleotidyltransferase